MKSILDFFGWWLGSRYCAFVLSFVLNIFLWYISRLFFVVKIYAFLVCHLTAFTVAILYSAEHLLLVGHFPLDIATG